MSALAGDMISMSEDEVLAAAREILSRRTVDAARTMADETQRLYKTYASKRDKEARNVGKPKTLNPIEALLLVALERNKYEVEAHCAYGNTWHGDAMCRYHVREGAITMRAASRQDALLALWSAVSGQDDVERVQLTEDHLQGSLIRKHLHALWHELRQQEQQGDDEDTDLLAETS